MSTFRTLFAITIAMALLPAAMHAQERGTITGQVVDQATQQPLAGAQVTVGGTQLGTLTNQQGRFLIPNVLAGTREVRVALIGYTQGTQQVNIVAGQTVTANFALSQSAVELSAVIVTATGQQQRTREIGNAVGTINVAQVELAPVNSLSSLIQGRSAGVSVNTSSGESGAASRIRIRGSNSVSLSNEPLVIVDGIRITSTESGTTGSYQTPSRLNDFSPENIESIEILKGPAAAALYGTAAANGVIQITTRRARGGATRWSFFSEQARIEDATNYPASYRGDCFIFEVAEGDCQEGAGLISFNPLETPGFSPFRRGDRNKTGVNVSGGSDAVSFFLATDFERENGIYVTNRAQRLSLRANLDGRFSERLGFSLKSGYVNADITMPPNDNNLYGYLLNGLLGSADPEIDRGTYGIPPEETEAFTFRNQVGRFTSAFNVNLRATEWLNFVATAGLDRITRHDTETVPPNRVRPYYSSLIPIGYRESNRFDISNFTGTVNGTATVPLRPNIVSTSSVGGQYALEQTFATYAFGRGLAPGTSSLSGTSRLFTVGETNQQFATLGAFFQQQFALNDRIYLTGAVRGDENSAFGADAGFAWYPSLSASWVVSEEPWFPIANSPLLNNLRLRAAWGRSGLRPRFRDAITYYAPEAVRVGGAEVAAVTLAGTGNVGLRPEIATELEVGFDVGLIRDRLGLEFTYYNKTSDDALVQRRLPPSLGLTTSRFENIGSVNNRGVEALINARVLQQRNVRWELTLTGSTNRNELVELGEGIEPIILSGVRSEQRHQPGFPLGGFWGRPLSFQDRNNDGLLQIDEVSLGDTAVYLGSVFPKREASLITNLTLFNWLNVSALMDHKGGHVQHNFTRFDRCAWEMLCEATYLRSGGDLRDQAGIIAYNILTPGQNTVAWLEKADFVKLREVSVSMTAPGAWTNRFGMNNLRLTLAGRNLKTWTDYKGFDPEVNSSGPEANFLTYDYYTTPPLRYMTARIDFNF
jgi:TonB-dependent starch-binding outer membrane protein SusC